MPLFGRREQSVTAHTTLRTNPESTWGREKRRTRGRAAIERDLRRQLAILAARHETGELDEPELGLVVQAHRNIAGSYAAWRSCWDRRLRQIKSPSASGALSADRWPDQIVENGWGLILLCVPPGTSSMVDRAPRLKTAATSTRRARRDVVLAMPLAARTTAPAMLHQTTAELMGMDLVSTMLGRTPDLVAPRLAPPVLEWVTADGRRALDREVISWGLPWPLPAPQFG